MLYFSVINAQFWMNFIAIVASFFLFCILDDEDDKKSLKILNELENIDDECEEKNIDFVKTSDENVEKEYDLPGLPALAFYRNKFRTIYTGKKYIHTSKERLTFCSNVLLYNCLHTTSSIIFFSSMIRRGGNAAPFCSLAALAAVLTALASVKPGQVRFPGFV